MHRQFKLLEEERGKYGRRKYICINCRKVSDWIPDRDTLRKWREAHVCRHTK